MKHFKEQESFGVVRCGIDPEFICMVDQDQILNCWESDLSNPCFPFQPCFPASPCHLGSGPTGLRSFSQTSHASPFVWTFAHCLGSSFMHPSLHRWWLFLLQVWPPILLSQGGPLRPSKWNPFLSCISSVPLLFPQSPCLGWYLGTRSLPPPPLFYRLKQKMTCLFPSILYFCYKQNFWV